MGVNFCIRKKVGIKSLICKKIFELKKICTSAKIIFDKTTERSIESLMSEKIFQFKTHQPP